MRKQRLQRHYILRGFQKKNKPEFEAKNFYIYLFNSGASEEVRVQWVGVSSLPGMELVSSGFATSTLAG